MSLNLVPYEGKKGHVLYAVGTVAGRRVNRSTGFNPAQKDAAKMRAIEIELDILREAHAVSSAPPIVERASAKGAAPQGEKVLGLRLREAFDHYSNRPEGLGQTSTNAVRKFIDAMETDEIERTVASIGTREIYGYVTMNGRVGGNIGKKRPMARKSPSTIRREINAIQAFINFALDLDGAEPIKVRKPPEAPARKRYLTVSERDQLIAACSGDMAWFKPLMLTLFYAGLRRSELAKLKWRDIIETPHGQALQVMSRKGRAGQVVVRIVPLHPKLEVELTKLPRLKEYVFLGPRALPMFPVCKINRAWDKVAERAKVVDVTPHDARRTLATHLMDNGVGEKRISDLLGHVDGAMLGVYAQITDEGRRSAVLKLT